MTSTAEQTVKLTRAEYDALVERCSKMEADFAEERKTMNAVLGRLAHFLGEPLDPAWGFPPEQREKALAEAAAWRESNPDKVKQRR